MKKIISLLMILAMILCFAACDSAEETPETTPTPAATTAPAELPEETTAPAAEAEEGYSFTLEGVTLVPGTVYDAFALPEPESVYQVPSCAIEGTDNVYSFSAVEITAFFDGTKEIIYSVAILDPNVCTDEGLYLGDSVQRVIELYGENYTQNGTAMVYSKGNTMLTLIIQNDFVVDIEFSWITE